MIRIELGAPGRARVIGSLVGESIQLLLDVVSGGAAVLDLSEVERADERAVRVLAGLSRARCSLVACPRWLALWVERERFGAGGGAASELR